MGSLEGKAARAHILVGEGTAAFTDTLNLDAYFTAVKAVFATAAESQLARIEFENLKQSPRQPITQYHSAKVTAYVQAVNNPAAANNFGYLRTHMLKGIYSPYVRQKVIEANVANS